MISLTLAKEEIHATHGEIYVQLCEHVVEKRAGDDQDDPYPRSDGRPFSTSLDVAVGRDQYETKISLIQPAVNIPQQSLRSNGTEHL